jgi:hypothetical protein
MTYPGFINSVDRDGPATNAFPITPDDVALLPQPVRGIHVGEGGHVVLDTYGGQTAVRFANVQTGTVLPVTALRVRATGTTANSLIGLY